MPPRCHINGTLLAKLRRFGYPVGEVSDMEGRETGTLLRRLRQEANMTQRELAETLHVSAQAVSKWETGVSHN